MWWNIPRMSLYLLSLFSSLFKAISLWTFPKCRWMLQTSRLSQKPITGLLVKHHRRVSFSTLLRYFTNEFVNGQNSLRHVLKRDWLIGSPHRSTPSVSSCPFLFTLVFCHTLKVFTAYFLLHFVFLGIVSDKAISSFSIFGERNRPVAIITLNSPRLKIILSGAPAARRAAKRSPILI